LIAQKRDLTFTLANTQAGVDSYGSGRAKPILYSCSLDGWRSVGCFLIEGRFVRKDTGDRVAALELGKHIDGAIFCGIRIYPDMLKVGDAAQFQRVERGVSSMVAGQDAERNARSALALGNRDNRNSAQRGAGQAIDNQNADAGARVGGVGCGSHEYFGAEIGLPGVLLSVELSSEPDLLQEAILPD
jgi:hypothetical protein